jgi:hypothetical protein
MPASAHVDILRDQTGDETGAPPLAVAATRMLRSALFVIVSEAGIDLSDYGGDAYAPPWSQPWPTGKLVAPE